jgi:hypothetical protein
VPLFGDRAAVVLTHGLLPFLLPNCLIRDETGRYDGPVVGALLPGNID